MIKTLLHSNCQLHAWIDKTAMYMLVLYMLSTLVVCSLVFSLVGLVSVSFVSQLTSLMLIIFVSYGTSIFFSNVSGIVANHHSSVITGLIIFFLVTPAVTSFEYVVLAGTVTVAIVSKYVLVYRKQHLFNAAAVGVLLLGLSGLGSATWWVATPWLLIPILVTGTIVVLKIRKWELVVSFLLTGFLVYILEGLYYGDDVVATWSTFFLSYPMLFLGFFMLTEPFSMPPTKKTQIFYGALVGLVSNTSLLKTIVSMTPELALIVGNLAAYPFTLKRKLQLVVHSVKEIAARTYELSFIKPVGLNFKAGQYLEWMLPHSPADTRGIRRYFTIASSPTEDSLRFAVKIPESSSTYKQKLQNLREDDVVVVSQLAGDFVLPNDATKKIAMVAGGIGVTPFRSHLAHLARINAHRDIVLFYCNNTVAEIAYKEFFATLSHKILSKTVYVLAKETASSEYETGFFSVDIVKRNSPDYAERFWYISGPPPMVNATEKVLRSLGVTRRHIKKDFFPGLA